MDDELEKKLKNDIRERGFPLEIKVLRRFSEFNTGRYPNKRFQSEAGNQREIDLHAFFSTFEGEVYERIKQFTSSEIIVECKKSEGKPWVFFESPMYDDMHTRTFLSFRSQLDESDKYEMKYGWSKAANKISKKEGRKRDLTNHYLDTSIPICTTYFVAFKNHGKSPIYNSIEKLLAYKENLIKEYESFPEEDYPYTQVVYPVMIVQGKLLTAQIKEDKEIELCERDHVQVRHNTYDSPHIFDVIRYRYLRDFVKMLANNHKDTVKQVYYAQTGNTYDEEIDLKAPFELSSKD